MNILHIVGARPQFIKLAPLVKQLSRCNLEFDICHTGQHYDRTMSENFFIELDIELPKFKFNNNNKSYSNMLSNMIVDISSIIDDYTDVFVYGDTLTTLAGAMASIFCGKTLHHIESGIRCKNLEMPEEKIRRIVDESSNYLYCLTEGDRYNLSHVGGKVSVVGDLMYENFLSYNIKNIGMSDYVFVTIHREENTRKEQLTNIVNQLNTLSLTENIIFPIHPRTKKMMELYEIKPNFEPIDPISYGEVLSYIKNCNYVISDSGGVPKEAYWLGKKSVVVMKNLVYEILKTEKYNIRSDYNSILENIDKLHNLPDITNFNLFGDGKTSKKIVESLSE